MFEQKIQNGLFNQSNEKTFIDKILAKQDVEAIRKIIKKPRLSRDELLEVLYLIGSTEAKLLNYGEWDRYVILKFFVWIREFVKIIELYYDIEDKFSDKQNTCKSCKGIFKDYKLKSTNEEAGKCKCNNFVPIYKMKKRTRTILDDISRLMEHNAKFLIDLYLNIGRTSLSVGATGIMELLKNKYELVYPNMSVAQTNPSGIGNILSIKR